MTRIIGMIRSVVQDPVDKSFVATSTLANSCPSKEVRMHSGKPVASMEGIEMKGTRLWNALW